MEELLSGEMRKALEETRVQIKKLDSRAMLSFLMRKIVEVLKVERACICKVLAELEECRLILGEPKEKHGIGKSLPFSSYKHLREAVETKSPVQKKEPGLDPDMGNSKELIYFEGITAILAIPILVNNEAEWLMVIDAKWPRTEFTDEERDFCLSMTDSAGLLLERDKRQKEMDEKETMVEIGEVAAEAAHLIKTPLISIGGFAKRLVGLAQNEPERTYTGVIVSETNKLEKIVDELLKFAKPKRVNPIELDLNQLVKEAGKIVSELSSGRNIVLDYQLNQLPLLMVNPEEMSEVFLRIFKNAVEAIKEKGEILVKSWLKDDYVRVTITNTGGCVDEKIIHEIFNPFFTTKPGGVGMGLAVANKIVKAYDGEIKVENDEQLKLTTFIVRLPTNLATERG